MVVRRATARERLERLHTSEAPKEGDPDEGAFDKGDLGEGASGHVRVDHPSDDAWATVMVRSLAMAEPRNGYGDDEVELSG